MKQIETEQSPLKSVNVRFFIWLAFGVSVPCPFDFRGNPLNMLKFVMDRTGLTSIVLLWLESILSGTCPVHVQYMSGSRQGTCQVHVRNMYVLFSDIM